MSGGFKFPEKGHFTMAEVRARWGIDEASLQHYLIEQRSLRLALYVGINQNHYHLIPLSEVDPVWIEMLQCNVNAFMDKPLEILEPLLFLSDIPRIVAPEYIYYYNLDSRVYWVDKDLNPVKRPSDDEILQYLQEVDAGVESSRLHPFIGVTVVEDFAGNPYLVVHGRFDRTGLFIGYNILDPSSRIIARDERDRFEQGLQIGERQSDTRLSVSECTHVLPFALPPKKPDQLAKAIVDVGNRLFLQTNEKPSAKNLWDVIMSEAADFDLEYEPAQRALRFETQAGPSKAITFRKFLGRYKNYFTNED